MGFPVSFSNRIYFIGIGGIGMSSLALFLSERGFNVVGSDKNKSDITYKLEKSGIQVNYFHSEANLRLDDMIVYSSAIAEDNIEYSYAKNNHMALVSRARLLSLVSDCFSLSVGVSGTHGKTTVTALIAHILKAASYPFTAFIGGEDKTLGSYFSNGKTLFLAEVCEYKKNINYFTADIGLVLNVDNDHLDSYKNFSDIKSTFDAFLKRADKKIVYENCGLAGITFGFKKTSDYRAEIISFKNGVTVFTVYEKKKKLARFSVKLSGGKNVLNALAAVAVARELNIDKNTIKRGLLEFEGVKRRNETIGKINGAPVIADYAHHPAQIAEQLDFQKKGVKGKLFVVFQPHTYSRTKNLFNQFVAALVCEDNLFVFKTYAARENFLSEGSSLRLCKALPKSIYYDDENKLFSRLKTSVEATDKVLILGAGDIYDKFKKLLNDFS